MKRYVFDTDISGFVQNEYPAVMRRINSLPADDSVATTIITFGEDMSGWLPSCRRAPNGASRARAYARLLRGLDFYKEWVCLPFDDAAAAIFDLLKRSYT